MRKRWTWFAAAAVVVLAAAGLLVVLLGGGDEQADPAAPPAQPAAPPAAPSTPEGPEGDQALPTSAPPVRWELLQQVAVPFSAEAGPREATGPVARDFQRSPVGALLAAWQIDTRRMLTPGEGWRTVTDQQIADGPGKDAFLRARSQVNDPSMSSEELAQLAGFRFVTYTPDSATIQLASKSNDGALIGTTVTVRWIDGDWRLELQPNGASSPTATPLQDLTYYTPFAGV